MFSEAELTQLKRVAGAASWQRGEVYVKQNRVHITRQSADEIRATATGSDRYQIRLWRQAEQWHYQCDCPVNMQGDCCKHIVATALVAASAAGDETTHLTPAQGNLAQFLQAQPAAWLAETLLQLANQDPDLHKRLVLMQQVRGQASVATLKKTFSAMIGRPQFLDYQRSRAFAHKLAEMNDLLAQVASQLPTADLIALCDYLLQRLIKIYENSDDSAGMIGGEIASLGALYVQTCCAANLAEKPKPAAFYQLLLLDDWGFLEGNFDEILGEAGAKTLENLITVAWQQQKANPNKNHYDSTFSRIKHLMQDMAKQRGDVNLLIEIYSQELDYPHTFGTLVKLCQAHERKREAVQWAERGVKMHPNNNDLRTMLATMYAQDGLEDEALELQWQNFCHLPNANTYLTLRTHSKNAWSQWREKAIHALIQAEQTYATRFATRNKDLPATINVSTRVSCLLAEGNIEEARLLATPQNCHEGVLLNVARAIVASHPEQAVVYFTHAIDVTLRHTGNHFYAHAVDLLREMQAWMPSADFHAYVDTLRIQHKARRNFVSMLTSLNA